MTSSVQCILLYERLDEVLQPYGLYIVILEGDQWQCIDTELMVTMRLDEHDFI